MVRVCLVDFEREVKPALFGFIKDNKDHIKTIDLTTKVVYTDSDEYHFLGKCRYNIWCQDNDYELDNLIYHKGIPVGEYYEEL